MSLKRIIMHWTAGTHTANSTDQKAYHEIVEGDGTRILGDLRPEANISTKDGHYAAHVRRFNTGSIGLSMAAMHDATQTPFYTGRYPITPIQLEVFVDMVAEYAEAYDIEITQKTVLTHAEVEPIMGIKQRGKWDITWLPDMKAAGDPIEVGNRLRELVKAVL